MRKRRLPFQGLLVLALVVVGALVAYTYFRQGRIGLWPAPITQEERDLRGIRRELRETRGKISDLQAKIAMGMKGVPRDEMEAEVRTLQLREGELERRVEKLEAEVRKWR